jgi:hypothetical protein
VSWDDSQLGPVIVAGSLVLPWRRRRLGGPCLAVPCRPGAFGAVPRLAVPYRFAPCLVSPWRAVPSRRLPCLASPCRGAPWRRRRPRAALDFGI